MKYDMRELIVKQLDYDLTPVAGLALGLPFRRYRLWRRMALVVRSIAQGRDLTAAALEAGFSSSAHLSSSFKRMFRLSASEVIALGVAIDTSEGRVVLPGHTARRSGETELQTV